MTHAIQEPMTSQGLTFRNLLARKLLEGLRCKRLPDTIAA